MFILRRQGSSRNRQDARIEIERRKVFLHQEMREILEDGQKSEEAQVDEDSQRREINVSLFYFYFRGPIDQRLDRNLGNYH
jgi:hypothetical protein